MTIKKIRVGLVGAGNWAAYGHIPSLKLLPDYELVAIHSRSQEKADALAAQHGFKYALTSVQALVEHPEVDFVLVLNPAPSHAATVRAAIAAGKDVYSEWPLTPSKAVSAELIALGEPAGVPQLIRPQPRPRPDLP